MDDQNILGREQLVFILSMYMLERMGMDEDTARANLARYGNKPPSPAVIEQAFIMFEKVIGHDEAMALIYDKK